MNRIVLYSLLVVLGFTACNTNTGQKKRNESNVNVLIWEGIIAPDTFEKFEESSGISVNVGYYESNEELLSKLQAGAGGIDLIFPSDYMIEIMIRQGLLAELDMKAIANTVGIDSSYIGLYYDPDYRFSIPYQISTAGIAVNTDHVTDFEPSWALLWSENYKGRISMLDDMRYGVIPAQKILGHSANTTDEDQLREAFELLVEQRQVADPLYSSYSYNNLLKTEEIVLAYAYSGDVFQIAKNKPEVAYFIPAEGTNVAVEAMCIPRTSEHKKEAHKLIDFILRPEVHAEIANHTFFANANRPSWPMINEEIRNNPNIFLTQEVLDRCEFIKDLGASNKLYQDLWSELKLAK